MSWNPLKKPALSQKPTLSNGLASHEDDRDLEMSYNRLQDLEDSSKKLYKEVKKYEDCLSNLQKLEHKIASDLINCSVCHEKEELRKLAENYSSVVYQMGHATDDLAQLSQKTVVDPLKKLSGEFPSIQAAIKKRDQSLLECQRCQLKYEKMQKMEKTGNNIVKTEQCRRTYQLAKDDFDRQNRLLLLELPQFYAKRVDYFQPCLQALIRSQVDYYGETTRLFTHLVAATPNKVTMSSDDQFRKDFDKNMSQIRSLSIVGK